MSCVESFETLMSKARILMADCDMPFLDGLQAAHDAEMKQLSKEEFHRGYESGVAARDAEQWQLDRERQKVVCRLRGFEAYNGGKPSEEASRLIRCIIGREDCHVACCNDLEEARDRLIDLLGGENVKLPAELDAELSKNGKNHQTGGYDVLGNERDEVVRELRKLRDHGPVWGPDIILALGLSIVATNDDFCDRLIYLLDGKSINKGAETSAKVVKNGEKYQLATYDVLGNERHKAVCELRNARDGMSDSMAYNVSRIMYAIGAEPKVGERVCKTIADRLIHLLGGDQPTLQEMCESDETASNDDETCPIPVQLPSITDELREYAMTRISPNQGMLESIADRIDEQFVRICSQQEAVLQQTLSGAVDEHEREMAELRQKLSARDAIIDNYHERMKGLDEAERRMAVAESKCKELQSKYDNLLVTCNYLTSLANKYFNEVNELFSDETN